MTLNNHMCSQVRFQCGREPLKVNTKVRYQELYVGECSIHYMKVGRVNFACNIIYVCFGLKVVTSQYASPFDGVVGLSVSPSDALWPSFHKVPTPLCPLH